MGKIQRRVNGGYVACPRCAASSWTSKQFSEDIEFRGAVLPMTNLERMVCESCGFSYETDAQREANYQLVRAAYVTHRDSKRREDGLLEGREIEQIRKRLGLTQREAASLFGGGPNAFNKYESGEVLQSVAMDRLLRVCYHYGQESVQLLLAAAGQVSAVQNTNTMRVYTAVGTLYRIRADERQKPLFYRYAKSIMGERIGAAGVIKSDLLPLPHLAHVLAHGASSAQTEEIEPWQAAAT